ncbi:MAG: hypothetical protein HY318_05615 [Armatimonadetes bacterium]|nr:hypothetical protein [Armatimonadota bacterium]
MNQQHRLIEQVLFDELPKVIEACEQCGVDYVLVGALAVRPYLTRFARLTRDLDIVVRAAEREKVLSALTLLGYHVQRAPGWAAATKQIGHVEFIVDIMDDTICEPATNQKYQVQVASVTMATKIQPVFEEFASRACMAPILPLEDAVILKLLSGRDKDLIDHTALLLEAFRKIDLKSLHEKITTARLQMAMSMAVAEWRNALESGELGYLWEVTYDQPLTRRQVASLLGKIDQLVPE